MKLLLRIVKRIWVKNNAIIMGALLLSGSALDSVVPLDRVQVSQFCMLAGRHKAGVSGPGCRGYSVLGSNRNCMF